MSDTFSVFVNRIQRVGLIVGAVGLIMSVIGLFTNPVQTLHSYLFAYIFWITLSFGALAALMIQYTVRNNWGVPLRRLLEAGMMFTLPLMALLFVPIALGMGEIYPWTRPELVRVDPLIQAKSSYLNQPFFLLRTVAYFVIWIVLAYLLTALSRQQDSSDDPRTWKWLHGLSLLGAILIVLTCTFAMIDWIMSLEPDWFSSIYPATIAGGGLIAAFALAIAGLALFHSYKPLTDYITPSVLTGLGSLLLAGLMFWAYLAFSQYIVIYSGNLSDEISWYISRLNGGWEWVAVVLAVGGFAVPFFALFSAQIKRNIRSLGIVAGIVFFAHILDIFWLVTPAFHADGFYLSWLDLATLIGIGGLWIAAALAHLKRHPLVPTYPATWTREEVAAHG